LLLALSVTLTGHELKAGSPTELEKNPPVTFASPAHPWSFSAGVTVRSIDADFHLSAPPALNWRGLVPQQRGLGDVGLFSGGATRRYDNGSVGPDILAAGLIGPGLEGRSGIAIGQGGNRYSEGRTTAFLPFPLTTFDFYSHSYSYSSSLRSTSVDVSDSDVGVGPYLEFSRRVVDGPSLVVDAFVGWSYVETSHSSGYRPVATQSVVERDVRHTYSYEGVDFSGFGGMAFPGFPNASGMLLYDAALYNSLSPFPVGIRGPRQTDRATSRAIASFYAVTGGSLDVNLNEIPFGVKVGRKFGDLTVFAELGGLLAVIDYDLSAESRWYRSNGALVSRQSWHGSDADVKMGVFGGVSLQYDLSQDGRWFAEAHGTYRWVDSAHASAGPVRVKIDVSSWEGGIGLGYRF
jgi:hypothetical protein